jgi:TonB-dependent receptor
MSHRPNARPVPHRLSLVALAAMGISCHATGHAQAAAPAAAASQPAPAASTPRRDVPESDVAQVVVTGTRASLERAMAIKRDAAVVQDSITATELGRFPDDNVADSLAHITGVSISRTAGGEGQYVSVRGLGPEYTLTTFNGRILGTDGAGRDFAFDVLPSDIINGADVVKSTQASLVEGGIGGLINLRSASPFDQKGQHGILRLEGDHNTMTTLNGRKLSATYSNTFGETLGVLVGMVYSQRHERTDEAGNDGGWERNPITDPAANWAYGNTWGGNIDPNNDGVLDPDEEGLIGVGQTRVGSIYQNAKRIALSGKVEWRPNADLKVVADGIWTKLDAPQKGYMQSFYPLYSPGRWDDMVIKNGVVTSFTMANPDPELRMNPELLNKTSDRIVNTGLYGLNAEWHATPDLLLTTDVYTSTSSRHSGGHDSYAVLRMNQPNTTQITLNGGQVPDISVNFDDGRTLSNGLANGQFTAADFNTHYFELSGDNVDDRILGASEAAVLQIDKFHVDQLKFGVSLTSRKKTRKLVDNDFNNGANYFSDQQAINLAALGGNILNRSFTPPNFMQGVGGNFPRTFLGFDIDAYVKQLQAYNGHTMNDGSTFDYANAAPAWDPLQSYRVTERTTAGWLEADLSGESWSADVGVRLIHTATTALAYNADITGLTEFNPFNYAVEYGPVTPLTQDGDYTYALPAGNFTWHISKPLQLRLGAAKTMARPSVDKLAPSSTTQSVSYGDFTEVFGGNAKLKPYSALQFDASLEYYYAKDCIASVAVYQKNIKNQITTVTNNGVDIGVPGHLFSVQMPINGDRAKVRGIEFGLTHLWANGFGVRAQYTRNRSKSWVDGFEQPLEGIAPATSSLGLLYEKGAWSTSVTGDHTAQYVTTNSALGQGYNAEAKAITWLTGQLAYNVTDHLRVSLEGRNLLNTKEEYVITNGTVKLPNGYDRYGRAFTLGMSLSL